MSTKTAVYFKKVTRTRKAVVFCVERPTAAAVKAANAGNAGTASIQFGGTAIKGRKAFQNFGTQYFVQMDCTKLNKSDEPKVGTEFQIVTTTKPVINQETKEELPQLFWGYVG